jgi:hypothetical protein
VKQQRDFFGKRLYISDNADLARLCLAIIAPVSPTHQDFEDVLYDLERARKGYRMSKNCSQLLRLWIRDFQADKPSTKTRLTGDYWKTVPVPPLTDTHFIGSLFQSFSHQCSIDGRRIGGADCTELTIYQFAPGTSGPAPYSRTWASAKREQRKQMRFVSQVLREEAAEIRPSRSGGGLQRAATAATQSV